MDDLVRQSTDSVYKQVGLGAVVLKEWLDQTRLQLESSFRNLGDALQKQIDETCRSLIEKNRGESESLLEELRTRLEQAARALETRNTRPPGE